MKKTYILLLGALAALTSCGMTARSASSDDNYRFQDGIYGNTPSFRTKEEKENTRSETDALVAKTKESPVYLFGDRKDTIMIPENYSARIQFDQKVGGTVITVGENPYDWRWDLENRYGYWYGPYSSWHWNSCWGPYSSPYWGRWSCNPWRYSFYYDPWYYGWPYDSWYYGGYHAGYWGWHDPWHHYHHHHGWYAPHHHPSHKPPHHPSHKPPHISGGSHPSNRHHALRAHTERSSYTSTGTSGSGRSIARASGGTVRGGMSIGNTVSRSSTAARSSKSPVSRSSGTTNYRRPASSSSTATSSSASASSGYTRSSSYDSGASNYSRSSSSYSRSSSGYSRSSAGYSGGSSSGSYSRSSSSGGSGYSRSSSGSYRR